MVVSRNAFELEFREPNRYLSSTIVNATFKGHIFERISVFYHVVLKILILENCILVIHAYWKCHVLTKQIIFI